MQWRGPQQLAQERPLDPLQVLQQGLLPGWGGLPLPARREVGVYQVPAGTVPAAPCLAKGPATRLWLLPASWRAARLPGLHAVRTGGHFLWLQRCSSAPANRFLHNRWLSLHILVQVWVAALLGLHTGKFAISDGSMPHCVEQVPCWCCGASIACACMQLPCMGSSKIQPPTVLRLLQVQWVQERCWLQLSPAEISAPLCTRASASETVRPCHAACSGWPAGIAQLGALSGAQGSSRGRSDVQNVAVQGRASMTCRCQRCLSLFPCGRWRRHSVAVQQRVTQQHASHQLRYFTCICN